MTPETLYSYADGDKLNDRNTYFYTPSVGAAMLQAWTDFRAAVLEGLPPSAVEAPPSSDDAVEPLPDTMPIDTRSCMEWIWQRLSENEIEPSVEEWVDKLVRKFETVKRFHRSYDPRLLAVDKTLYEDLELYVRGAEIMLRSFELTGRLPYLNVLLKITDTLCSTAGDLTHDEGARLARLIRAEYHAVMNLTTKT